MVGFFVFIGVYLLISVVVSVILRMCGYAFIDDDPICEFLFGLLWPLVIIALILLGFSKIYSWIISAIANAFEAVFQWISEIFNKRNRKS